MLLEITILEDLRDFKITYFFPCLPWKVLQLLRRVFPFLASTISMFSNSLQLHVKAPYVHPCIGGRAIHHSPNLFSYLKT